MNQTALTFESGNIDKCLLIYPHRLVVSHHVLNFKAIIVHFREGYQHVKINNSRWKHEVNINVKFTSLSEPKHLFKANVII